MILLDTHADRLIIATAMERQAPLISLDGAFAAYFESRRL